MDAFLLQLPLGTGSGDAVIEEAVGAKLAQALSSRAVLQQKLADWWVTAAAWWGDVEWCKALAGCQLGAPAALDKLTAIPSLCGVLKGVELQMWAWQGLCPEHFCWRTWNGAGQGFLLLAENLALAMPRFAA